MKKILLFLFLTGSLVLKAQPIVRVNAPVDVESTYSIEELVKEVLLGNNEECNEITILNVVVSPNITGADSSYGYFHQNGTNFPFEKGIVISTGKALDAGNNVTGGASTDMQRAGDPDLATALGVDVTTLHDAAYIEFDFIPVKPTVSFNYLMASQEYTGSFPCKYTDGFALLLKEAGDPNYTNIAVLPNTTTAVSVTNIHPAVPAYPCAAINEEYFAGTFMGNFLPLIPQEINLNGRTIPLEAVANVIPNKLYHFKFVVADWGDGILDTAVFLEAYSLGFPEVNLGEDISVCEGPVTLNAGTFPTGTTFLWNTGETTPTINVSTSGTYSVTVTSPSGCSANDDIKVTINSAAVNLGADISVCEGTPVTLNAGTFPTGTTFLWNTGETTQTIEVSTSGTYSVTVTSPEGCSANDEIQVTLNSTLTVNLGEDISVCEGSVTLNAGTFPSGTTFLWNTGETTPTINVSASGIYSVTVTSSEGCSATDEIQVTINSVPTVNLGEDISVCEGTPVTLNAGIFPTGTTFLWSIGETTPTINVSASGLYSVTVTSPAGCSATDEIQVTINSVTVNLGEDISVCEGTPVTLNAGNFPSGTTFLWNTGETTPTINVSVSGLYSVTVTSLEGCSKSDEIEVSFVKIPVIVEVKIIGTFAEIIALGDNPLEYSLDL
ncbi:MAG: choice-of-anchor L domain-containing protein, partial [Flavobacteriaceae bacterium]|nr:choice-of-anchor L domain-containing protein [Flavobacteriaceae bacterium]